MELNIAISRNSVKKSQRYLFLPSIPWILPALIKCYHPGMQEKTELWKLLCAQAAVEQDPKKLHELIRQINELLDAKERRLNSLPPKGKT